MHTHAGPAAAQPSLRAVDDRAHAVLQFWYGDCYPSFGHLDAALPDKKKMWWMSTPEIDKVRGALHGWGTGGGVLVLGLCRAWAILPSASAP